MQTSGIEHLLAVQAAYTAAFLAIALLRFARTDVLS
jgi:ABC-type transport system involved in multi-copper enzyme maturation permease subunit